jgi:hypothetical protein
MNMTDAIEEFLSSPLGTHFKFFDRSWVMYDDGFWVLDVGNINITRAIMNHNADLGWKQGEMMYMNDRMRRQLAHRLRADRLPARYMASPSPAGPPSETPAPADPSAPGQPYPPAPPVVPETAELADRADTGGLNGHTP